METLKKVSTKQDRGNFDKKLNQDNIQNLQGELDAMRITINSKMILNHIEHFKEISSDRKRKYSSGHSFHERRNLSFQ